MSGKISLEMNPKQKTQCKNLKESKQKNSYFCLERTKYNPANKYIISLFAILILTLYVVGAQAFQTPSSGFGTANYQYYEPSFQNFYASQGIDYRTFWPQFQNAETCEPGNDFFVTIPPGGCSPAVVRSDLLAEQNVPIFCKLTAIRTNPIVDVAEIRSVSFAGQYPKEVLGISYHPSKSVLRSYNPSLESSIVNDVGYIVVLLRQQPNERNISDAVRFNLTANIQYDLRNTQGIGKSTFFLPVVSDAEWNERYSEYSFWQSKGFIRADYVDADRAKISIYRDANSLIRSFDIRLGQTSDVLYIPGFYCRGGLRIALREIGIPKKTALLQVGDEKLWVAEGSKFLERCFVEKIETSAAQQTTAEKNVTIVCEGKKLVLSLAERVKKDGDALKDDNIATGTNQLQIDANFENAKKTAFEIVNLYTSETNLNNLGEILGAQALLELGETAKSIKKEKTAVEIYEKLIKEYPDTSQAAKAKTEIAEIIKYDTSQASGVVIVAGKSYPVVLEDVSVPTQEDASAEFSNHPSSIVLMEGQEASLNNVKIKLVKLIDSSNVIIDYTYNKDGKPESVRNYQAKKGEAITGTGIILKKVNFIRVAGIELLPEFPNQFSRVNVSVNIGIEKRNIQLSPNKIKEKIDALNGSIERYDRIANRLEKWVDTQSKACTATSTILLIKNLFQNFGGKGMARNRVMNMPGGWNERCNSEDMIRQYGNVDNCIFANRNAIESDVNAYATRIQEINKRIQDIEKATAKTGNFDVVFIKEFAKFVQDNPNLPTGIKDGNNQEQTLGNIFANSDVNTILRMKEEGKITIEQMKNIMLYGSLARTQQATGQIINEFASKGLKNTMQQIEAFQQNQNHPANGNQQEPEECKNQYQNPQIKIYGSGVFKGKAQLVPVDVNRGWYAATRPDIYGVSKPYTEAGQVLSMYLCNVGKNGKEEFDSVNNDDRPCIQINLQTGQPLDQNPCFKDEKEAAALARRAKAMLEQASSRYASGARKLFIDSAIDRAGFDVVLSSAVSGAKCTDFMSPLDCKILFNICDPVLCPASRCNFGGQYPVANVIQSGIIGSALLCLPNFKEGIMIPVCLTGIKEGIKGYVSLLKSRRDCLQESLTTGKQVGICDEMSSIYMCEFIWRQAGPLIDVGILKLAEMMLGQNRGGAEYMTASYAWESMRESVNFLRNTYTSEIPRLFKTRAIGEMGSQVCKGFISANYPIIGDLADTMMKPESPFQFNAWFKETLYSDATVPPTSHYKVYYHIYSGTDSGAYYSVYLRKTPELGYYAEQPQYIVSQGYVSIGQHVDESKDFTAPAGYKELCININGQEECGFKSVSSDFALDYLKDKFMEQQATDKVESEQECVGGSSSFYSLLQPNIQAGVEEMIQPGIYNRGIVRVCSSDDPGKASEPGRWQNVGFCNEGKKIYCWLDTKSVKEAIKFNEIEGKTLQEIGKMATDFQVGRGLIMDEKTARSQLDELRTKLKQLNENNLAEFVKKADELITKGTNNQIKANALFLKFEAYRNITNKKAEQPAQPSQTAEKQTTETEQPAQPSQTPPATTPPPAPIFPQEISFKHDGLTYRFEKMSNTKGTYNIFVNGEKRWICDLSTDGKITKLWELTAAGGGVDVTAQLSSKFDSRIQQLIRDNFNIAIEKQPSQTPQKSAEIEFEEDDFWVPKTNIYYQFIANTGKWMWKCPPKYPDYLELDDQNVKFMASQFIIITSNLKDKDYNKGVQWIEQQVNEDSDAYLIIHYQDGCTVTTDTRVEDLNTCLLYTSPSPRDS